MTNKEELKFFDPQIEVKEKAVAQRLQYVPNTKIPLPLRWKLASQDYVIENAPFALEALQIMNIETNL